MPLTHGSLFTGVGGFDLGADAAGIETLWQCEIKKQARSVLAKHWPNVTRYEDVRNLKGNEIAPVDIISFGSPCQDLSIVGNRVGLVGERSGLFHEAIRIAKEMHDATNGEQPRFLIWENVRGALSSNNGGDFAEALEEMATIGAMDISWRLVNACHTGVPQRRVRVFVVADLGGECAGQILSRPTRLLWHPTESQNTKEETSGGTRSDTVTDRWRSDRRVVQALTAHIGGVDLKHADAGHLAYKKNAIRRLTPLETERLNGWPDDHTRWAEDGTELKDYARYPLTGNGIVAPVAQWLCENIVEAVSE